MSVFRGQRPRAFFNIAKDGGVLRFCCLLHDIIFQLSNLSKSLQKSAVTLAEAHSCLSSTQAVIEKYKSRYRIEYFFSFCP